MRSRKGGTFKFGLGARVRDRVHGLAGVVAARHEYLNGCVRYTVEWRTGEPLNEVTFDEQQLEVIPGEAPREPRGTGGPRDTPAAPSTGGRR